MTQEEYDKVAKAVEIYEKYPELAEIVEAWMDLELKMKTGKMDPLLPYRIASERAIREKYSQGSG